MHALIRSVLIHVLALVVLVRDARYSTTVQFVVVNQANRAIHLRAVSRSLYSRLKGTKHHVIHAIQRHADQTIVQSCW